MIAADEALRGHLADPFFFFLGLAALVPEIDVHKLMCERATALHLQQPGFHPDGVTGRGSTQAWREVPPLDSEVLPLSQVTPRMMHTSIITPATDIAGYLMSFLALPIPRTQKHGPGLSTRFKIWSRCRP